VASQEKLPFDICYIKVVEERISATFRVCAYLRFRERKVCL